jgi:hypothetical protein
MARARVSVLSGDEATPRKRAVVAKLVFAAEVMADLAQMIGADRPEPEAAFARMSTDAVKHRDPFGLRAPPFHAAGFSLHLQRCAESSIRVLFRRIGCC